ncbi:pseudouridine synthase, partial [Microvirga sp. 3-52]|nr:pseudouridine synthase [Microvirga sp. 3-52]
MERLQKVMAQAGIASRRKSEELIVKGKVKVNGVVVTELGTRVSSTDQVEVEGIQIVKEENVY